MFAKNNGLLHYETSAKTGQGVREMFAQIVKDLPDPDDKDDGTLDITDAGSGGGRKKKGCC